MREHVPLRDLTTLKIGGTARYFVSVATAGALAEAVSFAKEKGLPIVMLGGGSNVLVSDGTVNAVVIKIDIRGIEWGGGTQFPISNFQFPKKKGTAIVIVGAGESWDGLVAEAVKRGLWGVENLSGIPGTVGAAPIQNIGAYGTEIKDVLERVEVFDVETGALRTLSNAECRFGYRESIFKQPEGKSFIITRVALRLSKNGKPNLEYKDLRNYFAAGLSPSSEGEMREGVNNYHPTSILPSLEGRREKPTLAEIRAAVLKIRSRKFPDLKTHGTAGSFFKNPIISQEQFDALKKRYPTLPGFELRVNSQKLMVKLPLAWILDNICNLKGYRKGAVALFERQPVVLVQTGGASADEIEVFAREIAARVKEKTGIEVEWEVQNIRN